MKAFSPLDLQGQKLSNAGLAALATDLARYDQVVPLTAPQGRLTLASGQPVMSGKVTSSTIYYTPYVGNIVPLWNGTTFVPTVFGEVSQALSDATKSPAAVPAGGFTYDLFLWNDAGTVRLSRGPVWSTGYGLSSARGYSLNRVNGLLVNGSAITNGPAAGYGLYLGTIASDGGTGSSTVTWDTGSAAAGGYAAFLSIWNYYNRVSFTASVQNTTNYSTVSTTYITLGGNAIYFTVGVIEDIYNASASGIINAQNSASTAFTTLTQTTTNAGNANLLANTVVVGGTAQSEYSTNGALTMALGCNVVAQVFKAAGTAGATITNTSTSAAAAIMTLTGRA